MTEDNKDLIQGRDLLVAYYDVDYEKNAKGSNYWRNRYVGLGGVGLLSLDPCAGGGLWLNLELLTLVAIILPWKNPRWVSN